jgi:serpin B
MFRSYPHRHSLKEFAMSPQHLFTRRLAIALISSGLFVACGPSGADDDNNDPITNNQPANNQPANNQPANNQPANNQPGTDVEPPGVLQQSLLSREDNPSVSPETLAELTAGHRDMAFNLFNILREEEGPDANVFVSPHSIASALAMTYAGSANATKAQMAEALSITLDDEDFHRSNNVLDRILMSRANTPTESGEALTLDIVNQTFGQVGFNFEQDYLDVLAMHYGAGLRLVDFISDGEGVRQAINAWVEARTRDRISNLLPEGVLNPLTRFVLVNAIYFYGSWQNAFDPDQTTNQPFSLVDGSSVDVPLMRQQHRFGYYADVDTVAASLPYAGNEVSMILWMPADPTADFTEWEAEFTRESFDTVAAAVRYSVEAIVHLPRFQTEGSFSLSDPFKTLGMVDAFDPCDADFSPMTGAAPCTPEAALYISAILHKTFVKVDEEGTEAAAATAVIMDTTDSVPDQPVEIRFDRPFYYAVYDHGTGTVLFMGRLMNPVE